MSSGCRARRCERPCAGWDPKDSSRCCPTAAPGSGPGRPQDLEETYELRAVLEGLAARRAATRIDPVALDEMDRLAATMMTVDPSLGHRPAGEFAELAALNARFHELIVTAAGSAQLASTLHGLVQLPLVMRTYRRYTAAALARSHSHHREIVDALRAGDGGWAESVMRSHVLAARAVLLDSHREDAAPLEEVLMTRDVSALSHAGARPRVRWPGSA